MIITTRQLTDSPFFCFHYISTTAIHTSQTPTFGRRTPLERLVLAVVGRTEASVANRKAIVQFSRPVASRRCPSRRTWRLVAPSFLRRKYKAQEPEASAEQGAARKLRQGNSAMTRGAGERSPALLNGFLAWGSQLSSHKSCSQERPPSGCSRWLGRPLPSRDKVSEPSYVPVMLARADL